MINILITLRPIYLICIFTVINSPINYADTFEEGGDAYVKGDYETAAKKFLEIAERGDHRAMYALGSMHIEGKGVKKDYKKAFKWLSGAAKYGRVDAQYKVGLMYEYGLGVSQNYKKAARIYIKAAKKGYAHSQFKLGLLYAKGFGIKQNNVRGYAWLIVASQNLQNSSSSNELTSGGLRESKEDIFAAIHVSIIDEELEFIKKEIILPEEIEEANRLAQQYMQY
jgi:TPR repeat protein